MHLNIPVVVLVESPMYDTMKRVDVGELQQQNEVETSKEPLQSRFSLLLPWANAVATPGAVGACCRSRWGLNDFGSDTQM